MSAIGGKADMAIGTCPLSWSLSGVKRTLVGAPQMSANRPKRTRRFALRMPTRDAERARALLSVRMVMVARPNRALCRVFCRLVH
jgi:hypothetical protein